MSNVKFESVVESEGRMLAEIRARSMKPSLENVGRFDENRVRSRFLETFSPSETKKIIIGDRTVGFYVVTQKEDHIHLDHLYVEPDYQGAGIGASVLSKVKAEATEKKLPIRLGALKESRSNEFYIAAGFTKTHEDEFDIYYEWNCC